LQKSFYSTKDDKTPVGTATAERRAAKAAKVVWPEFVEAKVERLCGTFQKNFQDLDSNLMSRLRSFQATNEVSVSANFFPFVTEEEAE
jgi:hypothetical protein